MDTYDKVKKAAAELISRRMYTCREIEVKLRQKKFQADVIEKVVSEFVSAGLLDDKLYAQTYLSESIRIGGKGIFRIKQELYAKGIARSIIDSVCSECEEDTLSVLTEYVEARKLYEGITSRRELEKLKSRLARRGFSSSEIRECLSKYEFNFEENEW